MSNRNEIPELKNQTPIQVVVGSVVELTQKGSGYVCICPFHDDHNKSGKVRPAQNKYDCFVCGLHIDQIDFLQRYYNITTAEAIQKFKDFKGDYSNLNPAYSVTASEKKEIISTLRITKKEPISEKAGLWYWLEHGVNLETLTSLGMYFVREIAGEMRNRNYGNDVPCFAYDSGAATKLYFPTHLKQYRHAWVGNTVTKEKFFPSLSTFAGRDVKTLYITAGQKDMIILTSRGYDAVTLTGSETTTITDEMSIELEAVTSDVRICYDTDATGIRRAEEIQHEHGYTFVQLPKHSQCKDAADFAWHGLFPVGATLESIGATFQKAQ